MNTQLPAYLANLGTPGLAARAAEGIGFSLPPHISIRGNQFTLVDAAGNKQTAQTTFLDVCIADICDVMCKMYYEGEWTPDSSDPPACWSANGVAPSIEAISPQSPRCDTCQWNKRGSDVAMDGKTQIKACRDEKWIAVLVPGIQMPLKMTITPGSFKNWRAYTEMFRGKPIDMIHVFTRLTFEQNKNGVLNFALSPTGYIDENTAGMIGKMRETKASDILVGRTDRPRMAAIAGPAQQPTQQTIAETRLQAAEQAQPQGFQPGAFGGVPNAGSQSTPAATQHQQPQGSPSFATPAAASLSEAPRRRRRTADQIAADNAAASAAGGQGGAQQAPFAQAQPQGAPFGVTTQPGAGAPTGSGGAFGIQSNAPPPPAGLDSALDSLFGGPK